LAARSRIISFGANYADLLSLIQDRQIFEIDMEVLRLESSAEAITRRLQELKTKREERLKELGHHHDRHPPEQTRHLR